MLLWQAMVVVVVDQGHNSWALPLILETRESGNLYQDLNGTILLKTWFRIYLKLWQCMQLCWAKYGKGCFPFKIFFLLVVAPIVKYFASTWHWDIMETFIKMGYNLQKSYLGAMGGGWDCNICSSWSIPSGHDPLCQKTNVQGKSKAKYKSIPDNRASGSDWKLLYQLQSTFVSNDWNPRWPTFACIFSPPEPSSSTLAANFNSKRNLPVIL